MIKFIVNTIFFGAVAFVMFVGLAELYQRYQNRELDVDAELCQAREILKEAVGAVDEKIRQKLDKKLAGKNKDEVKVEKPGVYTAEVEIQDVYAEEIIESPDFAETFSAIVATRDQLRR